MRSLIVVSLSVLASTFAVAVRAQPGCDVVRAPASLAQRLAWNGLSAGMVVTLPSLADVALRRATETLDPVHNPLGTWFRLCHLDDPTPFSGSVMVETIFANYIATHPGARLDADARANGSPVLMLRTDTGATCHAALQRRTREAHTSRSLTDLVRRVVADVSAAAPPIGEVGACVGAYEHAPAPRRVSRGVTLATALNSVAAQFKGTVWVAVETEDGRCDIGLIFARAYNGVCLAPIGKP